MHEVVVAIRYINDGLFAVLAVVAFRHWRQRRDRAAAWAATTFLVLATVALVGLLLPEEVDGGLVWVQKALLVGLLLFPYCLYRFAASFEQTARSLDVAAATATAGVIAVSMAIPRLPGPDAPRPGWFQLWLIAILVQWTALSTIMAVRLWRAGRNKPTVARRRMRLLSAASILLSLVLIISGTSPAGNNDGVTAVAIGLLTTGSALLFFIGLAPPTFVRLSWRRPEEHSLQAALLQLIAATTPAEVLSHLLPHAAGILGGRGVALVDPQGRMIGRHGEGDPGDESDPAQIHLEMQAGTLHVWTSPHTPFFGREELQLLSAFGAVADLALARCGLLGRLVTSEQRLREAQSIAHIGGWELDLESNSVVWSDELCRIFGVEPGGLASRPAEVLTRIHPDDREVSRAAICGAIEQRGDFRFDLRVLLPDGGIRVLHVQGRQVGGDGEPARLVGTGQDITDRKRAEQEVQTAYERERAAREAFERTNVELETFVYSVSHDLRSPVISLLGYLEYFRLDFSAGLPDEALHFLDRMAASGTYMQALIQDLLELSRVGRSQTSTEAVDLGPMLEDIRGEVRLAHPEAPISIDPMPVLIMNKVRARQLLTNLVGNALAHGGRPGVRVKVTADAGDDGSVTLVVLDDGPGIPERCREKVFGVFERLHSRDGPGGGTGIGLAVCRKIMETLGGTIAVADSPTGTKMRLWFPPETVSVLPGREPMTLGTGQLPAG